MGKIAKMFNINRHFILHLVDTGIIKPVYDVRGRGKVRLYSYVNLIEIGLFIQLTKLNLSHNKISILLDMARGMAEAGSLEAVVYLGVIARTDGTSFGICVYGEFEILPEDALKTIRTYFSSRGTWVTRKGRPLKLIALPLTEVTPGFINKEEYSYLFLVSVRNIKRDIDSKIAELD